ncbi:MAG TPA: phosphopantetheine-binding protein, partial [Bryobacteraceae bacterium]|nr:phosphopantetheine-binding protein [Bryobacteraceae bacterium]
PTEASALYVPPRTEREREVAAIWADLLKQERIGVNDNFFDLGGHSLLAVQLQNRLMRHFHSEISIVELFQRPTVSAIASLLASKTEAAVQA